jgi:hypothetical protein
MVIKKFAISLFVSSLVLSCAVLVSAQDATSANATAQQTPDVQKQQEEKLKLETRANALLEQVITEAQGLKLPENRIRVQIAAADMLWDRSAPRARGLFSDAGSVLGQMILDGDRGDRNYAQNLSQLRQDLVLTAGRHDAELGYQLLRSTQPQTPPGNAGNVRRGPNFDQQNNNLEQSLLATIAATDPKMAYQKAAESLDKGEYPTSLARVLAQLQAKDPEAFKKLSDKTLSRLGSDSIVTSREATSLALSLLRPGPRPTETSTATSADTNKPATNNGQVLSETAYRDLMGNAITAALGATAAASQGPRPGGGGGGGGRGARLPQPPQQTPPDETQTRQNNARSLLQSMQSMMTQIDQYLPERAQAVRQKLSDLGMGNNNTLSFGNQMRTAMQEGTSETLAAAASTAPPQVQPALYRQAAQKAVEEGNSDRALQIANDHLDEAGRKTVMQAVDFKRLVTTASPEKLNEIKQKLAALPSDSDRVRYLIDLTKATEKDNPKLALRFLEDARTLVNKRAANYREFEDQIRVADAFASIDSKRSFELLESGIAHLNELLSAAAVLNGFEVQIFKEGELSLRANSDLIGMVARYGQELAVLAKSDFERAHLTADKFQMSEPRLNAKLSIVQSVLGVQPSRNFNNRRIQDNSQFVLR